MSLIDGISYTILQPPLFEKIPISRILASQVAAVSQSRDCSTGPRLGNRGYPIWQAGPRLQQPAIAAQARDWEIATTKPGKGL